jgi:acyl-CoA synthetase (NDP forming)
MPVLGPNCYGLINYLDGALLWPDQHGGTRVERGVALIMQSSNIAINLTMNRRALPIAYVICLGNQASVGLGDVMRAVADDPRVSAIGLYIEGLDDPARFANAALEIHGKNLPIVALRGGRSAAGAAQTVSHTASITGNGAVMSAFLKRLGISEVASLSVLLESLKLLHVHGRLPGRRVLSLSCSGGEAALMADSGAGGTGLTFKALSDEVRDAVTQTSHPLVTVSNPFDYHTFDWARPERLKVTFEAVLAANVDLATLVFDWPREDRCDPGAWRGPLEAWCEAAKASGHPCGVVASLHENLPETLAESLMAQGVAPLAGIPDALLAIDAAGPVLIGEAGPPLVRRIANDQHDEIISLDEHGAKTMLEGHGLMVPKGEMITDPLAAVEAAERIGYPVVLKVLGIEHKSEAAAVRLDLRTSDAVDRAAKELLGIGSTLLVEQQITDGVAELIIGAAIDPVIGLHLMLGSGGVLVELVRDSEALILPTDEETIRQSLSRLKAGRLIEGYRGRPAGDAEAVVGTVLAVQRFLLDHGNRIREMDINPLIVRPKGKGAVAADVLIRMTVPEHPDQSKEDLHAGPR